MINNNINKIKAINSSITNIQNDFNSIYTPVSNPKYILDNIYLFEINFITELHFKPDTKKLLVYEFVIEDDLKKDSYVEIN